MSKYWMGLNSYAPILTENLMSDLNRPVDEVLNHKLVEHSVTLVQNKGEILPIRDLDQKKIAYVKLGTHINASFVKRLNDYTRVDVLESKNIQQLSEKLKGYNLVIFGFHTSLGAYANYKIPDKDLLLLNDIAKSHEVILDVFASPYSLLKIKDFEHIEGVVVSYQNTELAQDISAQMIFGAVDMQGKLPVNINDEFPVGHGLYLSGINRLGYSVPEAVGLDRYRLNRIDSVAREVMDSAMAPGMQVLVARKGKVVYRKSFGHFTYDEKKRSITRASMTWLR